MHEEIKRDTQKTEASPTTALAIPPIGQSPPQDRLSRLDPATSWAVTHVLATDEEYAIESVIRAGMCVCVSDGSFKVKYGTAAWAFEAESSVHRCTREDIPDDNIPDDRGEESAQERLLMEIERASASLNRRGSRLSRAAR